MSWGGGCATVNTAEQKNKIQFLKNYVKPSPVANPTYGAVGKNLRHNWIIAKEIGKGITSILEIDFLKVGFQKIDFQDFEHSLKIKKKLNFHRLKFALRL